jgi:N-acyl-D-aspartate/D-glutamate deacylase
MFAVPSQLAAELIGTGRRTLWRLWGDVAVKDGKIAMISGRIKATAMKEADATGCTVAPGAIDLHNHYDLPLNWDP